MGRCLAVLAVAGLLAAQDRFAAEREHMVRDQIASRNVRNAAVLKAMRDTPRHLFVPDSLRGYAYADHPLPLGHGQTISQPYIVALMTELLEPKPSDRVLEIGTGSGYQAAVLSPLVREVYTIEIVPELARSAADRLKRLGYDNVFVREGDGYQGWPEKAPFDKIILTAAPPEIPPTLIGQLKAGGLLVAPEGGTPFTQQLVVLEKQKDGKVKKRPVLDVRFVPMVKGAR